ncbi:MAG: 4-(cytidine 5'-diphospho)-2-C-methyl-D-erythritol kinase [Pseudomonadota bacterium]
MITVEAPAKVNLYLHVVGRRADGYHLLDSLVAFAGVGDTIAVEAATELTLTVDGPTAALLPPGDNIVEKAARLLAGHAGVTSGAVIRLTKRLPVAAGIGGGSADAAATLTALDRLWGLGLPAAELAALGLRIGADVPVCLAGRPTAMAGIGDRLSPAPALPPAWLVLVNPMVGLSTPAVFKARQGCFSDHAPLETTPRDAAHLAGLLRARRNDLTEAAVSLVPEVAVALELIEGTGGCLLARMSGSGATCFGLFAREAEAAAAAAAVTAARPGWWVAPAPLL